MTSVDELYQQVILDHNRSPRNFREIESPTHHVAVERVSPCLHEISLADGPTIDNKDFIAVLITAMFHHNPFHPESGGRSPARKLTVFCVSF